MIYYQDKLVWTAWFCPVTSFKWVKSSGKKQRLIFLQTSAWCDEQTSPGSRTSLHSEQRAGWPAHLAYINFSLCKAKFILKGDVEETTMNFLATKSSHTSPLFSMNCNRLCSPVLSFFTDCISAIILPQQILVLGYPSSPTLRMLRSPALKRVTSEEAWGIFFRK